MYIGAALHSLTHSSRIQTTRRSDIVVDLLRVLACAWQNEIYAAFFLNKSSSSR